MWDAYVTVPPGVRCQDESGRLWDILWLFTVGTQTGRIRGNVGTYYVYVRNRNTARLDRRDLVTLKAVCGPGDTPEPVITIMLPDED